ncbi:MAG: glycerol-3-phosphate dehydrogenase [Gammaproteobacteria bacterium]
MGLHSSLEHYEFRLVREALSERDILRKKAPHLIKAKRFILPHRPHLRPTWLIRIGLFLYDTLGGRSTLATSRGLWFDASSPLQSHLVRGFEYTDCWVDDARLVIANLQALREKGGTIDNYTRCEKAFVQDGLWHVMLRDVPAGTGSAETNSSDNTASEPRCVRARCLVNATGPWAQTFIEDRLKLASPRRIRLIKGSHLIVPRIYEGETCYILQNQDKRVVFVIPYLNDFTLIGTTDKVHTGSPETVNTDDDEIEYLLAVYNDHFKRILTRADIVAHYAGVRPLCDDESDDPSAITRDYTMSLQQLHGVPWLSVFGGKLTTYRKLAETALNTLKPVFPHLSGPWTRYATLPGGEQPPELLASEVNQRCAFVPEDTRQRWLSAYGTRYRHIVRDAQTWEDLGEDLGGGLTEAEVRYLCETEWARCAEDILRRRTTLYLTGPESLTHRISQMINKMNDK